MLVSTKGRYALRVMIDLAEHNNGEYITLIDIASRQGISEKYLESIMSLLTRGNMVDSLRGKGGGYKLNRRPDQYDVLEILNCTEGNLAPVSCLEKSAGSCERAAECRTVDMWSGLYETIKDYLQNVSLESLAKKEEVIDYVI